MKDRFLNGAGVSGAKRWRADCIQIISRGVSTSFSIDRNEFHGRQKRRITVWVIQPKVSQSVTLSLARSLKIKEKIYIYNSFPENTHVSLKMYEAITQIRIISSNMSIIKRSDNM